MPAPLYIAKVEGILEWVEASADGFKATQSINWLIDLLGELIKVQPFVNGQWASAKKAYNDRKKLAYKSVFEDEKGIVGQLSPMIIRDYITGTLADEQYQVDICERASRTIVHSIDALRTAISALKEEIKLQTYANQQGA